VAAPGPGQSQIGHLGRTGLDTKIIVLGRKQRLSGHIRSRTMIMTSSRAQTVTGS
jgi:hypothetical protein